MRRSKQPIDETTSSFSHQNPSNGAMRRIASQDGADATTSNEQDKLLPLHQAPDDEAHPQPPSQAKKIGTALFYAISSLGVIFANKIVLSTYKFPSVQTLALLQFTSTTIALKIASSLGFVHLMPISWKGVKSILPLSTCYLLNILTGLSATQNLSLPMMVLLRRASILMTMLLEKWMLNSNPSKIVQLSVGLMLSGALVAALGDLSFNMIGYIVIFFNDLFTALNGVIMKRTAEEYRKSKMTVLFLNSLLSAVGVSIIILLVPGEVERVQNFELYSNPSFVVYLTFASLMGSVLNLAIFLCTSTNSALTTTVVGCLKNVLTSYLGMFIGGDYIFSWLNFCGINLSIAGSLIYARATFKG
jgi:solute carrier family 35 protein